MQAFIKDIFVQCVRPQRLVIFYLKCAAYKSTYLLTYLFTKPDATMSDFWGLSGNQIWATKPWWLF